MTSPHDIIKALLQPSAGLKAEVENSINLDRMLCLVLAEGYIPDGSIIKLRSDRHSPPEIARAAREILDYSAAVQHTLASILLIEGTITLASMERALQLRATQLCGSYPPAARTVVTSTMELLIQTTDLCRKHLANVQINPENFK